MTRSLTSSPSATEGTQVHLPCKKAHPFLPDNYETSCKRLKSFLNDLREEPQLLEEYDAVIRNQIVKGIVEEVHEPETEKLGESTSHAMLSLGGTKRQRNSKSFTTHPVRQLESP